MEEALIKKVLPHSIEAERAVIGSMLMDSEALLTASEILVPEDFYGKQYGIFFEAMVAMQSQGKPVDLVTLQAKLKEMDVPSELAEMDFARELLQEIPTSANIKHYAEIVNEKSVLRKLIKINEEISNACYSGRENVEDILETTEKSVFRLVQNRNRGEFTPIKDIVISALDKIEAAAKMHGTVTGVPTGFTDLDYKTTGLQPSDLILIAARPSMGKTAFVLNLAEHVAFKKNIPVAMFSLEMSKEQLINRLLSQESRVDAQAIRTGRIPDQDWDRLIKSANVIAESGLIIDDTPSISISELRSKCRKYKLEKKIGLVMIDYLQLMTAGGRTESRQQEISDISRALKSLAREISVPVIALSQLSRAVEKRDDKRPMLSDLRESGAIEQDADVVMFLYRDDYYNPETTEDKGIAEVIIAKQRNGPVGKIKLGWQPQYTKFVNIDRTNT